MYSRSWDHFGISIADLCVDILGQRICTNATFALTDVSTCVGSSSQRTGVRVRSTTENVIQRVRICISTRNYNYAFICFTVWPTESVWTRRKNVWIAGNRANRLDEQLILKSDMMKSPEW